jgi:hypothetical protein
MKRRSAAAVGTLAAALIVVSVIVAAPVGSAGTASAEA